MASNKPIIVVRTDENTKSKIEIIAAENNRSTSKEIEHLIKKHIKKFEEYNGEIETRG